MSKSSTSPRSSPLLLQLFLSASNSKCGGSGSVGAAISSPPSASSSPVATSSGKGGGGTCGETDSTASSTIIRSLSKCFDGGVAMKDAVLHEDDHSQEHVNSKQGGGNANSTTRTDTIVEHENEKRHLNGGQPHHQWGPSHSYTSEDLPQNHQKKSNFGGSISNYLFKPKSACDKSPSNGSHANNSSSTSNKTAVPTTSTSSGGCRNNHSQLALKTGMASAPTTPGSGTNGASAVTPSSTTAAVRGDNASTTANFWNIHALPATSCRGGSGGGGNVADGMPSSSSATSLHSAITPLSSSAKAAAEAVFGMISNAENFIATSTGVSLASGGGLCSPRNSPISNPSVVVMEGIPEEDEQGDNENNICVNNNVCFEFEEFGFNPFVDNDQRQGHRRRKSESGTTTVTDSDKVSQWSPAPTNDHQGQQQPKGCEIRLKSSFSQLKAVKEMQIASSPATPVAIFGRTHPNNNTKRPERQQRDNDDVSQSMTSRALPDGLPFSEVSVPTEIERSVSELTMRSHGAFERHRSDTRRMAYYAVGRIANDDDGLNKKALGNRRCYFTGKAITYGMAFYAGSVQQGPHTLVVFCLPSALDLPLINDSPAALGSFWNKPDRERYLASLPTADENLLLEMRKRYPVPFDTLPVQVRSPHCWRVFVKFCFFSGLPIAEGETHYRVKSSVAVFSSTQEKQLDEEIALSHDVMEAVNGEVSAEILRLPNQKVFDYLRRHYSQQSSKLSDEVFDRKNWELVMAEV